MAKDNRVRDPYSRQYVTQGPRLRRTSRSEFAPLRIQIIKAENSIVTLSDIREAQSRSQRCRPHKADPVHLQKRKTARQLYLKPENHQPIGSFKLRGAYNKVASLSEEERRRGVITYSSGNHAQGVAYAARALGVKAIIVMPANAPAVKREATQALGAEIILVGPPVPSGRPKPKNLRQRTDTSIVPPYNDEKIIAGQGTMGLEILEDLPEVETVIAPVGGGGMISGIATAIKLSRPEVKVIGAEPEFAADAQASLRAGKIVQLAAGAGHAHSRRRPPHPKHGSDQL